MSGSSPLGDVFVSHLLTPGAVDSSAVGSLLEAQIEAARDMWPGLLVDPEAFVAHLASRTPPDVDPVAHLDTLTISDLYISYTCAQGNRAALVVFEQAYFPTVDQVLGRVKASPDQVNEIKQILRERFFVDRPEGPLGIAAFSGRGSLRGWIRISALREFYRLTEKGKRSPHLEDDQLQRLADTDDDPELDILKRRCRVEFQMAFRAALASLTARQRNLLRHHHIDGMSIDEIGQVYRVHRATVARWIVKARAAVFSYTRRALMAQMEITQGELLSVMRLVQSQMDVSIRAFLDPADSV